MLQTFRERNLLVPTKKQMLLGILCWVMYQIGFGLIFVFCFDTEKQHGYYQFQLSVMCASFILTAVCFAPFLARSFAAVRLRRLFGDVLKAYGMEWVMSFVISIWIVMINLLFSTEQVNPNQEIIESMVGYSPIPMFICTVILGPITEECLVRGMIFGPICRKSPLLAYVVSAAVFAVLHLIAGIGSVSWLTMLQNFISYLPSGIVLGWMYQRTGTLAGPIALHCFINLIANLMIFMM